MASEVQMEHCMDKVRFLAEDSAWEYLKKTGDKGASIFEIRCKAKRLSTWRYSSCRAVLERLILSDRVERKYKLRRGAKTPSKGLATNILEYLLTHGGWTGFCREEDVLDHFENTNKVYACLKKLVRQGLVTPRFFFIKPPAEDDAVGAVHSDGDVSDDEYDEYDEYDG